MKKYSLLFIFIILILISTIAIFAQTIPNNNEGQNVKKTNSNSSILAIAAAIAVGLGSIGAGYAVGKVGAAAVGAVSEKPEISGKVLLYLGLAEGIAIYGLIIAIMLLMKI